MKESQLNANVARFHRKKVNEAFMQGFGVAIGSLARDHDQPSMAADIMRCNGIRLEDLENCGIQVFDLKPIRKAWKQTERKV
jgi:hypothetical protein